MDAIQFGLWVSTHRRKLGWRSQRSLAESAQKHHFLKDFGISEDFLARLEAGQLVHPFRGKVRQRVLVLAWLLCKTMKDVRIYLRVAEITELSNQEATQLHSLEKLLTKKQALTDFPLPPRPTRIYGRTAQIQELVSPLSTLGGGMYAITGMPGVGKSAVAYEVIHQLASKEREQFNAFTDGIMTFSATGRRGQSGLVALLNEIAAVFSTSPGTTYRERTTQSIPTTNSCIAGLSGNADDDLAGAIDRVRMALATKNLLLLLDDVHPEFPLRLAKEALIAHDQYSIRDNERIGTGYTHRAILVTSRFIPAPALLNFQVHLRPLEKDAALELFADLNGRCLHGDELADAEQLCEAIGHLPLAIEVAATAAKTKGIPLSLLASRAIWYPLDAALDGEGELHSTLSQALDTLDLEAQKHFILLSVLGVQSFDLEEAMAVFTETSKDLYLCMQEKITNKKAIDNNLEDETSSHSLTKLAHTAAGLGEFVRHSLVELFPRHEVNFQRNTHTYSGCKGTRYQIHPLLHAHALDRLHTLDSEIVHTAEYNVETYALNYVECYKRDMSQLEQERELLLGVVVRTWKNGQYSQVVHLLSQLLYFFGWDGRFDEAERILKWGIQASKYLEDRYHQSRFMSRLGALLFYQGKLEQSKCIWNECLAIARSLGKPAQLWYPLANLANLAETLGDIDSAQELSTIFLHHAEDAEDPGIIADALLRRGTYARLRGERESAYCDVNGSLSLLDKDLTIPSRDYYISVSQIELARLQDDFLTSQKYTEAAVSSLLNTEDRIGVPELLFEQARFMQQLCLQEDARSLALRAIPLAEQLGAHTLSRRARGLLQQMPEVSCTFRKGIEIHNS
jgi:tetratricopeptide (TPR) repeat protein